MVFCGDSLACGSPFVGFPNVKSVSGFEWERWLSFRSNTGSQSAGWRPENALPDSDVSCGVPLSSKI